MIVTCAECSTSFQLDESRIPASGARVRCSRCKHAFFLANPATSGSQTADAIAQQAAQDSLSHVPHASSELNRPSSTLSPSTAMSSENEEEDWEFSEEVRVAGDDDVESESPFEVDREIDGGLDRSIAVPDAGHEADRSLEQGGLADSEELTADANEASGPGRAKRAASAEPARDASDFGSVDDFSALMENEDVETEDLGLAGESELGRSAEDEVKIGLYSSNGSTDDLGDPESWDLVGSDDFSVKPSRGRGITRSHGNAFGQGVLAAAAAFENGVEESVYEDDFSETPVLARHLGVVVRMVGWALTLAIAIGVLAVGLQRERQRWLESPQVVEVGPFVARTLSAGWVETSRAGFVLVVEGQLENTMGEAHWPGTLQLVLLDGAGARLAAPPIRPGMPLVESVLRESSTEGLSADAAIAVRRFRQTPLGPREVRPFEAVVLEDELPEAARRFALEVGPPEAAPIPDSASTPTAPVEEPPAAGAVDQLEDLSERLP